VQNTEYCCSSDLSTLFTSGACSLTVENAYVGQTKEALDLDVDLGELVSMLGSFLKYEVKSSKKHHWWCISIYYYDGCSMRRISF